MCVFGSFLHVRSCHLQIEVVFYHFPIWMSFVSVSCRFALTRTSSTMLNSHDKSGHPFSGSFCSGKYQSFITKHVVSCGWFLDALIWVEEDSLFLVCWVFLSWKGVGFFSNALSLSHWNDHLVFCFSFLLIWFITLVDFQILN